MFFRKIPSSYSWEYPVFCGLHQNNRFQERSCFLSHYVCMMNLKLLILCQPISENNRRDIRMKRTYEIMNKLSYHDLGPFRKYLLQRKSKNSISQKFKYLAGQFRGSIFSNRARILIIFPYRIFRNAPQYICTPTKFT